MSHTAEDINESIERLSRDDPTLKYINFNYTQLTDAELGELADCLLAHPDVVTRVWLGPNRLTDESGVKLARCIYASSAIELMNLSYNQFGSATYLALAAALRVNSSLQGLNLNGNQAVHQAHIDAAFVEALRLNPVRPAGSLWQLYSFDYTDIDFKRLRDAAYELGAPSLLAQLDFAEEYRAE